MINIQHNLFPYQERDMNNVYKAFQNNREVLFQAITSYGKTYSFCTIAKQFINDEPQKKVLILCHKEELVYQALEACIKMGMTAEVIIPSKKHLNHNADVYIGMEKTVFNRLQKNKHFLKPLSLVIFDETHILYVAKHIEFFKNEKVLGFTATPVLMGSDTFYKCDCCGRESLVLDYCHNMEMMEWSRPRKMSDYYDTIVIGASTKELIDLGRIVPDYSHVIPLDESTLEIDSSGEFSKKSLNNTFNSDKLVFDVIANYEAHCKGLKTMVFTSSTENNLKVLEQFQAKGYNAKLFDSVNDTELGRKEIVQWFENEHDAILINTGIFTTGFSSNEVQAIIVNRATKSLALWIQICGRGARVSDKIFKENFVCVDLGGNIARHNRFSDDTRDWERIFYNGLGKAKAKSEPIEAVIECQNCGGLTSRRSNVCEVCGDERTPKVTEKKEIVSNQLAQPLDKPQPPNAQKIIDFVKRKDGDMNLAFKIFIEQVVMLFRFHQVTRELYESTKRNGKFDKKINDMGRKFYFQAIASDLPQRKNVKLNTFLEKVKKHVSDLYN